MDAGGGTPLVRLRLLRERPFAVGMTLVVLTYAGINSLFLVLSLTLQDGLGMDALGAGLVYTPFAVAFFAASLLAGRLARFGRRVLLLGALTGALGFVGTIALTLNAGATLTAWELVPTLLLVGAGNGLLVTPLLNAVLGTIRPAEVGMASGVLSTGQQIGGAVGVALVGILYYGALGGAAHHDTGAYGHALAARWSSTSPWRRPFQPSCRSSRTPPRAGDNDRRTASARDGVRTGRLPYRTPSFSLPDSFCTRPLRGRAGSRSYPQPISPTP